MMGRAEAFSELNLVVQGTVRFGNGSLALIHGCGIMTLINKKREDQARGRSMRLGSSPLSSCQDQLGQELVVRATNRCCLWRLSRCATEEAEW
jgi:hypothetical protein